MGTCSSFAACSSSFSHPDPSFGAPFYGALFCGALFYGGAPSSDPSYAAPSLPCELSLIFEASPFLSFPP